MRAPNVAAAIRRCRARRSCATSVRSLRPELTIHQPTIGSSARNPVATATCRPSAPLNAPRIQNQSAGRMKAAPTIRASRRWLHSHQKMVLKPSMVMSGLRRENCGISPVAVELRLPVGRVQGRHDAGDRLPLGDRQARFGQARGAADQNHGEDERGDDDEPGAHAGSLRSNGWSGRSRAKH